MHSKAISSIPMPAYGIANNQNDFYELLGVQKSNASSTVDLVNAANNQKLIAYSRMTEAFNIISLKAGHQQTNRIEAQTYLGAYGTAERFETSEQELRDLQAYMKGHSDNEEGFIMWIDLNKAANQDCPSFENVVPDVLRYKEAIAHLKGDEDSGKSETVIKAKEIALVAKRVLGDIDIKDGGKIQTRNITKFHYNEKALKPEELKFWEDRFFLLIIIYYLLFIIQYLFFCFLLFSFCCRDDCKKILENFVNYVEKLTEEHPYQLYPTSHLNDEDLNHIEEVRNDRLESINKQLAQLSKAKYRNFNLVEFMGRSQSKRQEKQRGPEYQGKFIKEMKVEELKTALKSLNLTTEGN
jgi:hypothetical protein